MKFNLLLNMTSLVELFNVAGITFLSVGNLRKRSIYFRTFLSIFEHNERQIGFFSSANFPLLTVGYPFKMLQRVPDEFVLLLKKGSFVFNKDCSLSSLLYYRVFHSGKSQLVKNCLRSGNFQEN